MVYGLLRQWFPFLTATESGSPSALQAIAVNLNQYHEIMRKIHKYYDDVVTEIKNNEDPHSDLYTEEVMDEAVNEYTDSSDELQVLARALGTILWEIEKREGRTGFNVEGENYGPDRTLEENLGTFSFFLDGVYNKALDIRFKKEEDEEEAVEKADQEQMDE